ncbi:MAG: helix-turn-helix domain-containing protein [Janthinobacterium lividum]
MDLSPVSGKTAAVIGGRVRGRRISDNLTEEAVARALGCDVDYLKDAESGEISFSVVDIMGLCSILRVLPSWFFEELF